MPTTFVNITPSGAKRARVLAMNHDATPIMAPGYYDYDQRDLGYFFQQQDLPETPVMQLDEAHERVLSEFAQFWACSAQYRELGVQHRRGMLLHGPPGTGKTSLVRMLVNDTVAKGGIALSIRSLNELPGAIALARHGRDSACPCLVVMEDIDRISGNESQLTNVMDGHTSYEGVVFLATTNFLDDVPNRLKNRPGRFDRLYHIGYASEACRRRYIGQLAEQLKSAVLDVDKLVAVSHGLPLSHIRELVLRVTSFGGDHETEAAALRETVEEDIFAAQQAAKMSAARKFVLGQASALGGSLADAVLPITRINA